MSHEININSSGNAEMAYAGSKPWHHLGTQVPGLMTTSEALQAAHLDWEVEKVPVLSSKDLTVVPDYFTVIRKDNNLPLGVVGRRYEPISNAGAFRFFDVALGEGQGQIDTIGALGKGERVWCMAKMPESFEPLPGDPVDRYLLCWNSHDGSKAMEVLFTNIRVVCNNTLTAALRGASNKVSIKHTSNWEQRMEVAHQMLFQSVRYWEEMKSVSRHLARTSISRVEVGAFLDAMFPERFDKRRDRMVRPDGRGQVLRLMEEGRGADIPGVQGTKWGLYNAFTEFVDHEKVTRKGQDSWARSAFGSGQELRSKALGLLVS
jgi:phage/plasmid-like protein (TIGR03299 family)